LIPGNLVIVIQNVYCKYFAHSKLYRAIRCTVLLPDITEKNEQEQVIKEYHEKSNHRGIDETLAHLKRRVFFLHMKQAITQTINNCDSCQIQKYDRKPNKIRYSLTETPERPMEITDGSRLRRTVRSNGRPSTSVGRRSWLSMVRCEPNSSVERSIVDEGRMERGADSSCYGIGGIRS